MCYWLALDITTRPATKTPTARESAPQNTSVAIAGLIRAWLIRGRNRRRIPPYRIARSLWVRSGALNFPDGSLAWLMRDFTYLSLLRIRVTVKLWLLANEVTSNYYA